MRTLLRVVTAVLVWLPTAGAAQTGLSGIDPGPRRVDVSGSGGFLLPTEWGDLVVLSSLTGADGLGEQVLARELTLDPTSTFDAVVTYWEGRYGFRVHGGFAESCIAIGARCADTTALVRRSDAIDVDIWTYDVGGAIGLIDYRPDRWVWPYVFIGFGGITYDLDRPLEPPLTLTAPRPRAASTGSAFVFVERDDPDQLLIVIDELNLETKFAVTLGIATDVRIPLGWTGIGLRLEASDRIHSSPADVRVTEVGGFFPQDVRFNFGLIHNLRASAGVVVQFGR